MVRLSISRSLDLDSAPLATLAPVYATLQSQATSNMQSQYSVINDLTILEICEDDNLSDIFQSVIDDIDSYQHCDTFTDVPMFEIKALRDSVKELTNLSLDVSTVAPRNGLGVAGLRASTFEDGEDSVALLKGTLISSPSPNAEALNYGNDGLVE